MSMYSELEVAPTAEPVLLTNIYNEDPFPERINLAEGVYRDDEGKPWILPVVRAAEEIIHNDKTLDKEYKPLLGSEYFTKAATKLILGDDNSVLERSFGIQTVSNTCALRIGAEFLCKLFNRKVCYVADPAWENHQPLFYQAGFTDIRKYRYWHPARRNIYFEGLLGDLENASEGAVIVLQACGHNPTGCDPTKDQWTQIAEVILRKKLFPFFDSAYQGFDSGDLNKDAWSVRYFANLGIELFCAQSFSKNMGLYCERIGNLTVVTVDAKCIQAIKSQFRLIIRAIYLSPPYHGEQIVSCILNNEDLYEQWKCNLNTMVSRIRNMRKRLREELERMGTPGDWSHITSQTGMFSFTGLTEKQCKQLINNHHVYLQHTGRISISTITPKNVEYLAKSIYKTLKDCPDSITN